MREARPPTVQPPTLVKRDVTPPPPPPPPPPPHPTHHHYTELNLTAPYLTSEFSDFLYRAQSLPCKEGSVLSAFLIWKAQNSVSSI